MREFLLVVPDLMLASGLPREALAAALGTLRFGAAERLAGGWRGWLAARLRRPDLDSLPLAATVALAAAGAGSTDAARGAAGAWLATPLHLVAGLDTLHLPRDGILSLTRAERAELAADFITVLGGDGLSLHAVEGDALLLRGLRVPQVTTVEPARCLGVDLVHAQPTGPGAPALRRLMAEIEMWLHDHPVNRRREREGRAAVRSLWLWGGEARPTGAGSRADAGSVAAAIATATGIRQVYSNDAWVRAAARLAAVELAAEDALPAEASFGAPGDVLATASLPSGAGADLDDFEHRYLRPAIAALGSGCLDGLSVISADRRVRVAASDRYRVWRPRRAWLTALGAPV